MLDTAALHSAERLLSEMPTVDNGSAAARTV
jgi:hypothetical protein